MDMHVESRLRCPVAAAIVLLCLAVLPAPLSAAGGTALWPVCTGDCDADGAVTIDEIIAGVGLASGLTEPGSACPSFDVDNDGHVTIDEIVAAVAAAIEGCPEPLFPYGAYFWPDHGFGQSGSALADLAGFGLNTVVAYYEYVKPDAQTFGSQPDCRGLVEEARRFRMRFFIGAPQGREIRALDDDMLAARLQATVDCVGDSPFYRGWMIDEPELTGYDATLTERVVAILRRIDPNRRIWMNFSPGASEEQVRRFAAGVDVVGFDVYPVREGNGSPWSNRPLSEVGEYTDHARRWAPAGAEVWMILQAFGYSDLPNEGGRGRRPTLEEFRFMVYDALVHGAAGAVFFGSHQLRNEIPLDEPLWDSGVRTVGMELVEIGVALRRGQVAGDLRVQPASLVARYVRFEGREYLLVVNEAATEIAGTLHFQDGAARVCELPGGRCVEIEGDRMVESFAPWGVRVYRVVR